MSNTPLTQALRDEDMELPAESVNAFVSRLLDSHERLERQRDALAEIADEAIAAYSLMAFRDGADPVMRDGWRKLEEKTRATLRAIKEPQ